MREITALALLYIIEMMIDTALKTDMNSENQTVGNTDNHHSTTITTIIPRYEIHLLTLLLFFQNMTLYMQLFPVPCQKVISEIMHLHLLI